MDKIFLAIDIGGTNTKLALVCEGEIVAKDRIPTQSDMPFEEYSLRIKASFDSMITEGQHLQGIGVGAPNVSSNKQFIDNPHNLHWERADLVKEFTKVFDVPVFLENDASIAALGEKLLGKAQNVDNFFVLTMGTGIGSGGYIHGQFLQGGNGGGPEFGHITLYADGRNCTCGGKGHFETYLSCPGICQTYEEFHGESIGFTDFAKRFLAADEKALAILPTISKQMAIGIANLNATLSPDIVILAGGGSILGEEFLTAVRSEFDRLAYAPYKRTTKIELSDFPAEYGAVMGAYALVKMNYQG